MLSSILNTRATKIHKVPAGMPVHFVQRKPAVRTAKATARCGEDEIVAPVFLNPALR
jgi:hypothetical protein